MSTLDIRDTMQSPVDKIIFADGEFGGYATFLMIDRGDITLQVDDSQSCDSISIAKSSVENLIKALQKAIDLDWTK